MPDRKPVWGSLTLTKLAGIEPWAADWSAASTLRFTAEKANSIAVAIKARPASTVIEADIKQNRDREKQAIAFTSSNFISMDSVKKSLYRSKLGTNRKIFGNSSIAKKSDALSIQTPVKKLTLDMMVKTPIIAHPTHVALLAICAYLAQSVPRKLSQALTDMSMSFWSGFCFFTQFCNQIYKLSSHRTFNYDLGVGNTRDRTFFKRQGLLSQNLTVKFSKQIALHYANKTKQLEFKLMHSQGSYIFGWEVDAFTKNSHVVASENFLLFLTVLCFSLIAQHYVKNIWKLKFIPESLATIFLSAAVGGIIYLSMKHKLYFSPLVIGFSSEVFYFGLLPPIIFSSAYHLRRKLLYGNLGAVFVLAFIGTCISATITTVGIQVLPSIVSGSPSMAVIESVAFACVVAANDPVSTLAVFSRLRVDPALYYAVLGESVLNDAVAITAFRVALRMIGATTFSSLDAVACAVNFLVLVLGSSVIGYATAVLVAYVLRHVDFGSNKVAPIGVVLCTLYIPFFLTEMLQLSGIVTVFFSGIAARRYSTVAMLRVAHVLCTYF